MGALDGIRILELARYQAGPRAGMVLSDLGAETIKIEKPGGEETRNLGPFVNGQSVYFAVYNRGKKSICLNLRTDEGKQAFFDLLATADMVIENFRPGTLETMGLGFDRLSAVKPDIILLRASAFGQTGPYRERTGFDPIGQAMSGLMDLNGRPIGRPIGVAFSIADRTTALHLAIGALAALRHRDLTGEGQEVEVSLYDSGITMVEVPTSYYLSTGEQGGENGRIPFEAKDGYFVVGGLTFEMSRTLHSIVGAELKPGVLPTLDRSELDGAIQNWCRVLTVEEACAVLNDNGIVAAPVLSTPEVAVDPHLWAREMMVRVPDDVAGEMFVPGVPMKLSRTPGEVGTIPAPGQHTCELLREIGYDDNRIRLLRDAGVV